MPAKKAAALLASLLIVAACAIGCTSSSSASSSSAASSDSVPSSSTASIPSSGKDPTMSMQAAQLPDGVHVEGFKFTTQGSAMGPYYAIRKTDAGFECTTTPSEVMWPEIDGDEYWEPESDPFGLRFSRTILADEDMAELEGIVNEHGVLAWDGYHESYSPPEGVFDMDDSFRLSILLSDGRIVKARGYNREPEGFGDFSNAIRTFFETREDYSAYYPKTFPDSPATRLTIKMGDIYYTPGRGTMYSIELTRSWKRWSIVLADPYGAVLPAKTDIGAYADIDKELPFDTFLDLIRKYGFEGLNQKQDTKQERSYDACDISIHFENGQEYSLHTNDYPENYEAFRDEVVHAIYDYYQAVADAG